LIEPVVRLIQSLPFFARYIPSATKQLSCIDYIYKTFEKCSRLEAGFKFKEDEKFNRVNILNISMIKF
jgi:hypothetical protein